MPISRRDFRFVSSGIVSAHLFCAISRKKKDKSNTENVKLNPKFVLSFVFQLKILFFIRVHAHCILYCCLKWRERNLIPLFACTDVFSFVVVVYSFCSETRKNSPLCIRLLWTKCALASVGFSENTFLCCEGNFPVVLDKNGVNCGSKKELPGRIGTNTQNTVQ